MGAVPGISTTYSSGNTPLSRRRTIYPSSKTTTSIDKWRYARRTTITRYGWPVLVPWAYHNYPNLQI